MGAAWMIDGVGLMGGRGPCTVDGSDTMETISETCGNTFTDDSQPGAEELGLIVSGRPNTHLRCATHVLDGLGGKLRCWAL